MMKTTIKLLIVTLFVFTYNLQFVYSQSEFTMQIVLDKGVDAGELKLFPGVKDKDAYWYLPNKLRLAKNEDDTPKLSFIKWVHNEVNGTDEGMGGGVLHCVFGLKITDEELAEARQELKRVNPKGKIMGSVIYKSGTVTVSVPKLGDPDKEEVVSISPAPTMEGNFVAINMQLNKRSATLLWESFDTPNPMVTFNFNMVLAGYNSPMEAKITINREQIYDSQSFQAGLASPWLSAEVGKFMETLIDNGAIKIEKIGANFSMDKAINMAIQKATEEFFTPLGSSQGPSLSQINSMTKSQNSSSYLDKASKLLNSSRKEAIAEREAVKKRNAAETAKVNKENKAIAKGNKEAKDKIDKENKDEVQKRKEIKEKEKKEEVIKAKEAESKNLQKLEEKIAFFQSKIIDLEVEIDQLDQKAKGLKEASKSNEDIDNKNAITDNKLALENKNIELKQMKEELKKTEDKLQVAKGGSNEIGGLEVAGTGGLTPDDPQGENIPLKTVKETKTKSPKLEKEPEIPSFATVASYVVKKVRISGKKVISFKESHPTTLPFPFAGNLGVSRLNCKSCFREVNLDDKVFKQREILALLDGLNESDFSKYINYGTAQLRKKHESDEYTYKEVRITRKNFNQEGNLFKMVYGWKNDNDRTKWFDYEYKVAWSFFGGHSVESDWEKTNQNTINLSAPLQRKIITITADKDLLEEKKVRAIYVTIYYNLGGEDQIMQYAIDVKKDILTAQVEFMLPKGKQEYDYEITWRLWGNEQVKAERKTTSFETLYVDELPN